jgi:YVTN family beta-propeller protein
MGVGIAILLLVPSILAEPSPSPTALAGPATASTTVYVSNQQDNTVSVIDTGTNKVVATVPVGTAPGGVALTPDTKHA